MKRIIIIWPLGLTFYISNIWRSVLIYEVAENLRKKGLVVDVFDGCKHKTFFELFSMILLNHYDAVIINAPLDTMDGFIKTLKYIRILDATKPIYVYGISTLLSPKYFKKLDIQGFSNYGYFERGILSFLAIGKETVNCVLKRDGEWKEFPRKKGTFNDWSFMDVDDALKFPVIGMSISRGCQGGCNFCRHAMLHGNKDIRKPIDEVCDYLEELEKNKFVGIIEFISPTFTINKGWVEGFCKEYKKRKINIRWRCVTRVDQIEPDIIKMMAEANCGRIGLGIETMVEAEQDNLNKKIQREKIIRVIRTIQTHKIEVFAYLMTGIEDQTSKSFLYTYKTLKEMGVTIRVSALLRYRALKFEDMIDTSIASDMCTSSLNNLSGINNYDLLKLIVGISNLDEKYLQQIDSRPKRNSCLQR